MSRAAHFIRRPGGLVRYWAKCAQGAILDFRSNADVTQTDLDEVHQSDAIASGALSGNGTGIQNTVVGSAALASSQPATEVSAGFQSR